MKKFALADTITFVVVLSVAAASMAGPALMRSDSPLPHGPERVEAGRPIVNKPAGVLRGCVIQKLFAIDHHGRTHIRKVRVCG